MPDIEYRFGTGKGDPHVHHSQASVDVNGDGTADGVALDFDGDGRVDDVMWDSDGDGVADTALLDLNDDGKAESAYSDPTGQGTWNAHGQGGHTAQPPPAQQQPPAQETPADEPKPSGHGPFDPHPGGEPGSNYEPYDEADHDTGGLLDEDDDLFDDLADEQDGSGSGPEEWYDDLDR
jgi:hypothetical protein